MAIGLGAHVRLPLPGELPLPLRGRARCRSSGAAGTSRSRPGSATTSTCRSAATACRRAARIVNLVTVFFLCGLWHGASWTFVVWGLFHGAFLVLERAGARALRSSARPAAAAARLHAAGRDGRLGASSAPTRCRPRPAMLRAMAGASPALPTPYGVGWYLTPEVALALAAGAVGSTPLGAGRAARLRGIPRRRARATGPSDARPSAGCRRRRDRSAGGRAARLAVAHGRAHLQPVHLLPLLTMSPTAPVLDPRARRHFLAGAGRAGRGDGGGLGSPRRTGGEPRR